MEYLNIRSGDCVRRKNLRLFTVWLEAGTKLVQILNLSYSKKAAQSQEKSVFTASYGEQKDAKYLRYELLIRAV